MRCDMISRARSHRAKNVPVSKRGLASRALYDVPVPNTDLFVVVPVRLLADVTSLVETTTSRYHRICQSSYSE